MIINLKNEIEYQLRNLFSFVEIIPSLLIGLILSVYISFNFILYILPDILLTSDYLNLGIILILGAIISSIIRKGNLSIIYETTALGINHFIKIIIYTLLIKIILPPISIILGYTNLTFPSYLLGVVISSALFNIYYYYVELRFARSIFS